MTYRPHHIALALLVGTLAGALAFGLILLMEAYP
jgi:hypothetical protein